MEDKLKDAFYFLNSFKGNRSQYNIERSKPDADRELVNFYELKMYQFIDNLELTLRAIQKQYREENRNGKS